MKPKRGERKYVVGAGAEMPHIGQMLQRYIDEKRIYQAALARAIQRDPQTLLKYKKNHSIQAAILWELSHALKYNFFADLAADLPADFNKAAASEAEEKDAEIARLRAENERLQAEKVLLMEMVKR